MKELNKLKQELLIMKTEIIKPNYSELARLHECDRRTIKKYNEGYEGKPAKRNKESRLDKYKEEIKTKLELPGSTIKGEHSNEVRNLKKKIKTRDDRIEELEYDLNDANETIDELEDKVSELQKIVDYFKEL